MIKWNGVLRFNRNKKGNVYLEILVLPISPYKVDMSSLKS